MQEMDCFKGFQISADANPKSQFGLAVRRLVEDVHAYFEGLDIFLLIPIIMLCKKATLKGFQRQVLKIIEGIHPSTLRARMRKLGILRPEAREPD
jgi:hypothetical protein